MAIQAVTLAQSFITVRQRGKTEFTLLVSDGAGAAVDVSAANIEVNIRTQAGKDDAFNSGLALALSNGAGLTGNADGTIDGVITAAQANGLPCGTYIWKGVVTVGGADYQFLDGSLEVVPGELMT